MRHSWTFTLNKTDAMSRMLHNPWSYGGISVIASFAFCEFTVIVKLGLVSFMQLHVLLNVLEYDVSWLLCNKQAFRLLFMHNGGNCLHSCVRR